ncbi:MAG: hypothetical protein JO288_04545 [Hyphomicrobiales bacterium]|nr:hypothetical protein [Hyphomicrobiales bacterium]
MCEGWFTGKTLYEYFNSASNWAAAPDAIIGANAAAVAYVQKFGDALAAGGWPTKPVPQPAPPPAPPPAPVPTPPPSPATAPAAIPVEVMVAAGGPIALTVNLVPINVEQQSSLVSMIVDGTEYVGIRHTGGTGQKPAPSLQHRSMSMPTLPPNAAAWLNFGVTVLGAVAAANPAIFPVAGPQIVQAAGAILGVLGAFNGYLHLTSPAQAGPLGK